ncbi:MAG: hypothetical protein ACK40I_05365 [Tabrizicola sp.]
MRHFATLFVAALMTSSTQATAEICIESVSCAFRSGFSQAFEGVEIDPPTAMMWPQLYAEGDRPVARYAYSWALDTAAREFLLLDRKRFDQSVTSFSSEVTQLLCKFDGTSAFVAAGGIMEFVIGMHPKWESPDTPIMPWKEKIMFRITTCEAN